jgi:hypothetical protein
LALFVGQDRADLGSDTKGIEDRLGGLGHGKLLERIEKMKQRVGFIHFDNM